MLTNAQKSRIKGAFEHLTEEKLEEVADHSTFHSIARATSPQPPTELEFSEDEIEDAKQRAFEEATEDLDLFESCYDFMQTGDYLSEVEASEIITYLTKLKNS